MWNRLGLTPGVSSPFSLSLPLLAHLQLHGEAEREREGGEGRGGGVIVILFNRHPYLATQAPNLIIFLSSCTPGYNKNKTTTCVVAKPLVFV